LEEIDNKVNSIILSLDSLGKREGETGDTGGEKMDEEKKDKDSHVIFSLRVGAAFNTFPQFEEQLEAEINRKIEAKNQGWFKKKMPLCSVKKVSGLDDISKEPNLVLLCAYTESIRLDSSEIIPFINIIKTTKNPKFMLYCLFRFGDSSQEATIPDPNDEQKSLVSRDLVYNFHFYPSTGLIETTSTVTCCNNLFHLIKSLNNQ